MERRKFTREFKLEAVRLIKDRGVSYVLERASVAVARLGKEVRRRSATCFSWPRPDEAGAARDRAAKLKAERDILRCAAASLRSRQPIHQRAVPATDGRSRRCLFDEPFRQRLGQRRNGELLLLAEDRTHGAQNLPHAR